MSKKDGDLSTQIDRLIYSKGTVDLAEVATKCGLTYPELHKLLVTDIELRQSVEHSLSKLRYKLVQQVLEASSDKESLINVPATKATISFISAAGFLPPMVTEGKTLTDDTADIEKLLGLED